jgi:hypothetical protein
MITAATLLGKPYVGEWALVNTDAGSVAHCVVVVTNDSPEDMKKAEDLEMIRAVQKVVNVHTSPNLKWYKMPSRVYIIFFTSFSFSHRRA